MDAKPFYQRESFLLYLSAFVVVGILMVVVILQWDSLPTKIFVIALLLLFGVLVVRMPADNKYPRQTHLYLAVQSLLITLALTQSSVFVFLFFILSAQAMMILSTRAGLLWIGVFAFITLFGNLYQSSEGLSSVTSVTFVTFSSLISSAGFLFFGIFGNTLARARQAKMESEHLLAELTIAHHRLQKYTEQAEFLAVAEERNRLSRELHDTLGHRLTISIVQLEGAVRLITRQPQRTAGMIETVRAQLVEGLNELRRTLKALRNPKIAGNSLAHALQQIVHEFAAATGITLHTQLPEVLPTLSDIQHTTIYMAVQEALTNVQKHAQAQNVWLIVELTADALILTVRDDGHGLQATKGGHDTGIGLRGMRERAVQLGGTLYITEPVGGGVLLTLNLPLQEATDV